MFWALLWFVFAFAAGAYAARVGRGPVAWFFVALVLSPLVAWVLLLALPSRRAPPAILGGELVTPETHVRCPECRLFVRLDATTCPHCRTRLESGAPSQSAPAP